jgi:hypothetical protein
MAPSKTTELARALRSANVSALASFADSEDQALLAYLTLITLIT